jgi:hypothetical protein
MIPPYAYECAVEAIENVSEADFCWEGIARAAVDAVAPVLFAAWDVETLRAELKRLTAETWVR